MFSLEKIQDALKQFQIDAWLLYDFRGSNVLARRVLNLPDDQMGSRRCCYAIPADGEPIKLVHRIESGVFDHLPGRKIVYLKWQELEAGFQELVKGHNSVAMEYSPRNANPYISKVDAGTIELVQSFGVQVVDSGNLIQLFEAVWSDQQWEQHLAAGKLCDEAFDVAWKCIAEGIRSNGAVEESTVCDAIMQHFTAHKLTTYHPPIVAVGPNSADGHYETGTGSNTKITEGDFVLVDLWAKLDEPGSVYADMTRTGFVGESVPEEYTEVFNIVAAARDAAIDYAISALAEDRPLQGWEVDEACRKVIEDAGYGEYFVHRTGHNIGQEVHGNGAHMDNLETREERLVLPMTCFSVEPGIYQAGKFGVRSEVDVFVDADKQVHVTYGDRQTEIVPILKTY